MKIKSIHIYSHNGEVRSINFKINGLNIITGLSSTGKSSIINIVEYCLGKSDCLIAEGVITSKVSWVSVIYALGEQDILIAKKLPENGKASCSQLMLKRGVDLTACDFKELENNSNDDTLTLLFNNLLNIPNEFTNVDSNQTRTSFNINLSHTKFYLFQPQSLIANKDSLFYRQSESFIPQAIKDTFPIIVKAESLEYRIIFEKIKQLSKDINLIQKRIENEQNDGSYLIFDHLKNEASNLKIDISNVLSPEKLLSLVKLKTNEANLQEDYSEAIVSIQRKILELRKEKSKLITEQSLLEKFFSEKDTYFTNQKLLESRLSTINAFKNIELSDSQSFNEIIKLVKSDLVSISKKLKTYNKISDDHNKVKAFDELSKRVNDIDKNIINLNHQLADLNEANNTYLNDSFDLANYYILIGKIKSFIENINIKSSETLQEELIQKQLKLSYLKTALEEYDSISEKLDSIIFQISLKITEYLKLLNYEHGTSTTRFDLKNLTLITTRSSGKSIPMNKIGSGANHLALHISALLAFHYYFQNYSCPVPSFIIFDQPSQVYFPQLGLEAKTDLQINKHYNRDDIQAVKNLFKFLINFINEEVPNFQIIVTEHALFNEQWFTDCMIEPFWAPPHALVPENWPVKK
ncbi:hypothetical protein F951_02202 [Acinetobacter soli CIP 110264]|uniref:DUF3732 domain-containing protein n=1 Tax=Acinetobacter soli TaxID=487316 RepID=UPI0002CE631B|nr:DUF3732 domain-containing protein [Acinetobacter soli]ENV56504.1 hypothetical protein F951_02202 [Acinetobacter soli CIP 110264]